MTAKLRGVVFDMDGVIIESEHTHYRAICEAMGERMNQTYETFITKCTGRLNVLPWDASDDVAKTKPDPATYAKAAEGMGISPADCLAIDDSPHGVSSAKNAGMMVLGITAIHNASSLKDADWHLRSLEEVTLKDLINLFEGGS